FCNLWVIDNDALPAPGRHLRRPRRSHAAGHPGPAGLGRGLGHGPGPALRHEPARGLQAPQGAGARGAGRARAGRPAPSPPPRRGPPGGGHGVAGGVPPLLGAPLRAPGRRPPGDEDARRARQEDAQGGSMSNAATLKVAPKDDREIVVTREFDAPRALVYDAHTKPELLKRWLLGPDGWSLVVCDMDLRVGGAYRWVWRNASGKEMGLGGVFREIAPPERIVATERFDESWYPGEALNTTVFTEKAGRTTLTVTMRYES